MKKSFIEELKWRGMLHDMMPGTEEQLNKEVTTAYIGFDPTAPSLHIGNLATIMLLKHFQLAGHKPIALVGGATAMIGDPSGKNAERAFLSEETIRYNEQCIQQQLAKFLDFDAGECSAELLNNYDWFKAIGFLQFLRDVGKHITVNYMMAKDSVKNRMETGISYTEFTYQLMQGYDFLYLYQNKNCKLQMGGSDQWGNITTGTELIRRIAGSEAYALTTPLITKADGTKFGKSEGGENIWLDPKMTSPYKFYQFWINVSDEDAERLIKVFSLKEREEIEALIEQHRQVPHLRVLQNTLAEELTERIHSRQELEKAQAATEIFFKKDAVEALKKIDEQTLLEIFEGVPQVSISRGEYQACESITDLLSTVTQGSIFKSKSEARKAIQANSVSINKEKVSDPQAKPQFELLQGHYLLVQHGKKKYYLVRVND
ncbi:MAG: tyrosine--tRNA ligase [Thermonema sp.]|uniref:tyrosine--tRNA ligase n=1 Tax=Thermonema sp. TaxID=2231181 RepID=UPI0021DDF830|nr:tyrosine--tRNA ligase [Thermonema sp.]GIV38441.1 MAG: tyrosine--tRNA ligase [Thermonema sp.]